MHNFMMQTTCGAGRLDVIDVSVQEGAAAETMTSTLGTMLGGNSATNAAGPSGQGPPGDGDSLEGAFSGASVSGGEAYRPSTQRSHAALRTVMAAPRARAEPGGEVCYCWTLASI